MQRQVLMHTKAGNQVCVIIHYNAVTTLRPWDFELAIISAVKLQIDCWPDEDMHKQFQQITHVLVEVRYNPVQDDLYATLPMRHIKKQSRWQRLLGRKPQWSRLGGLRVVGWSHTPKLGTL